MLKVKVKANLKGTGNLNDIFRHNDYLTYIFDIQY